MSNQFDLKRINKKVVKPVVNATFDPEKVKGSKLFPEPYANVFMLGKKKSGKSSCIFKILKDCCGTAENGEKTKVYIFASTVHRDPTWKAIRAWLKKHGYECEINTSMYGDGFRTRDNVLHKIVKGMEDASEDTDDSDSDDDTHIHYLPVDGWDADDEVLEKKRKPKKFAPETIFVFDDLTAEISEPVLTFLTQRNRHFKSKVIISSHWYNKLTPDARTQIDYMLFYPKIKMSGPNDKNKLLMAYQDMELDIPWEQFLALYKQATAEPYNFLYVDTKNERFRKNFDQEFMINKPKAE